MKTEIVDVNETRKNVHIEIPSDVVDAEIDRQARVYSRKARIPGFRPGKAPATVIKQRYKEQILHDVVNGLIPPAVDEALRERGVEAVDTPDIQNVNIEPGQPLTFTVSFDTLPPLEPGEYATISLHRPSSAVPDEALDQAMQRLRDRAARFEPVEGRGVDHGDTVTLDLARTDPSGTTDTHSDVNVELGAAALKATTESEEHRLATVSDYLPSAKEWPDRRLLLTAIDVATGSLVVWNKRSSATLVEAVASSCAAPLVAPPTTINGRRYMDAGPQPGTSAQLAAGHDLVVVIAVARSGPLGPPLSEEVVTLRAGGSRVEVIVPDAESLAVLFPNLLDETRRALCAEAGCAQGAAGAAAWRDLLAAP